MDIDINADMGEGFGPYRIADDDSLMELVSSANVACGFHAGDPVIMDRVVRMAQARGVAIGAHAGLPDLAGFGRREIRMPESEALAHAIYQLGALRSIAAAAGHRVTHMSFHAALGTMIERSADLADAVMRAVATVDRDLIIYSMPGQASALAAHRAGLRTLMLFLADRAYDASGVIVPRGTPDALVTDVEAVRARVAQFLDSGTVTAVTGETVRLDARSILVHSDTPGAAKLARAVRDVVLAGGGRIVPGPQLVD